MMRRAYQIFGVLVLSAMALANYRGWAPGTEEPQETATGNEQSSSARSGYRGTRDGTIRNRTYRGGK